MRAAHQTSYGLDAITLTDLPVPEPGLGQVLIRVQAASINPADWHLAMGEPRFMRLSMGLRRPKQPVPGTDVCGIVESVGAGVDRWKVGDSVFGVAKGGFAEYTLADADRLAAAPAAMAPCEAASLPIAAVTALQAVEQGEVSGKRVVINGASGGVGHFAVQIARAEGASEIIAVCSSRNADWVRDLGADRVVDYDVDDFTDDPVDVIIDCVGNRSASDMAGGLVANGKWVLIGAGKKTGVFGPIPKLLAAKIRWAFSSRDCIVLIADETTERLERLAVLADEGKLSVRMAAKRPLSELRDAYDRIESQRTPGKLVIIPAREPATDTAQAIDARAARTTTSSLQPLA